MKLRWLVASVALALAACDSSPPRPGDAGEDALEADATALVDAVVAVDLSPGDTMAPDAGGGPAAPTDGGLDDSGAVDLGADVMAPTADAGDAGPGAGDAGSGAGDAGALATCGPGASREMLCTTYCDGMVRFCTNGNRQYSSLEVCRAGCLAPAWGCGNPGDLTGNTLFCRLAHMTLAGLGSAATECRNAGPMSPVCQ